MQSSFLQTLSCGYGQSHVTAAVTCGTELQSLSVCHCQVCLCFARVVEQPLARIIALETRHAATRPDMTTTPVSTHDHNLLAIAILTVTLSNRQPESAACETSSHGGGGAPLLPAHAAAAARAPSSTHQGVRLPARLHAHRNVSLPFFCTPCTAMTPAASQCHSFPDLVTCCCPHPMLQPPMALLRCPCPSQPVWPYTLSTAVPHSPCHSPTPHATPVMPPCMQALAGRGPRLPLH